MTMISRRTSLKTLIAGSAACLTMTPALCFGTQPHSALWAVTMTQDLQGHLAHLPVLRNNPIVPGELTGRASVINFFASWCPPCGPEAEILTALSKEWTPRGTSFVSINLFEDFGGAARPDRLVRFLDRYAPDFPVIEGTQQTAALFGGVSRIPTLFIFRPDGVLQHLFVHEKGASKMRAERHEIEEALTRALS